MKTPPDLTGGGGGDTINTFSLENYGTAENPIIIGGMSGGEFKNVKDPLDKQSYRVMYINNSRLIFENVTFTGGKCNNPDTGRKGGGLYIEGGSDVTLSNGARVTKNQVAGGSGSGTGGGIYVKDAKLTIDGAEISNNKADGSNNRGGGLFVDGADVTIKSGVITANTSSSVGGGIYITGNDAYFIMTGGTVSANVAGSGTRGRAGGICIDGGKKVEINGGYIRYNTAYGDDGNWGAGGGIYSYSDWALDGAVIAGNKAPNGSGGGVYVYGGDAYSGVVGTMTYRSGTISGNTARTTTSGHSVYRRNSLYAAVVGIALEGLNQTYKSADIP